MGSITFSVRDLRKSIIAHQILLLRTNYIHHATHGASEMGKSFLSTFKNVYCEF